MSCPIWHRVPTRTSSAVVTLTIFSIQRLFEGGAIVLCARCNIHPCHLPAGMCKIADWP